MQWVEFNRRHIVFLLPLCVITTNLAAENNVNLLSQSSGSHKSKICVIVQKSLCQQSHAPFWNFQRRICSFLFPASRSHLIFLAHNRLLPSTKANNIRLNPYHTAKPLSLSFLPPSSTSKDPCDYIVPTWKKQNNLPSQCQLITNIDSFSKLDSPSPYKLTCS